MTRDVRRRVRTSGTLYTREERSKITARVVQEKKIYNILIYCGFLGHGIRLPVSSGTPDAKQMIYFLFGVIVVFSAKTVGQRTIGVRTLGKEL